MKMRHVTTAALACATLLLAPCALAQLPRVAATPQPARQAPAPGVYTFGLPNPAGLTAPVPGQLTPPMPASLTPPMPPNVSAPGVAPGSPAIDAGVAAPARTGGVAVVTGAVGGNGTNAMGYGGMPLGPYSAVDIARAFLDADTNRDGELTRAEAQRLAIQVPFDQLDRNHDGILSRFEYDDFFQ
ncbi:MAG TPA: hypothetical protein VIE63_02175 [Ramlibacter sp.]|jgi:hypothetical protein